MSMAIQELAQQVGNELKKRGLKLVTAESCTGGGLSFWMTSIPGSSDWFERGFVTYSDLAKIEMLGVKASTIQSYGAVSEQTAREMAEGALRHSHGDISIAITGIAGPSGGSPEKPVGTVWIAWSELKIFASETQMEVFPGDRQTVREASIVKALKGLLQQFKLNKDSL